MAAEDKTISTKLRTQPTIENIVQLPDLILENIIKFLPFKDIFNLLRVCKVFYNATVRSLRAGFFALGRREVKVSKEIIENEVYRRYCNYFVVHLIRTEYAFLKASCARQVEKRSWNFTAWKTLDEYEELLRIIRKNETVNMIEGISNKIMRLNDMAYCKFDDLTKGNLNSCDVKYFGLEIIEVLALSRYAPSRVIVTHDSRQSSGSCYLLGSFTLRAFSLMKIYAGVWNSNPIVMLMYLRNLVRANNSDILLKTLQDFNPMSETQKLYESIVSDLYHKSWTLTETYSGEHDVQDVYVRDSFDMDKKSEPSKEVEKVILFEYQLLCPKSARPLGLKLLTNSKSDTDFLRCLEFPVSQEREHVHAGPKNEDVISDCATENLLLESAEHFKQEIKCLEAELEARREEVELLRNYTFRRDKLECTSDSKENAESTGDGTNADNVGHDECLSEETREKIGNDSYQFLMTLSSYLIFDGMKHLDQKLNVKHLCVQEENGDKYWTINVEEENMDS